MSDTKLIPNTTQVPNVIIDEWMPRLSDTEFKILMVITRQTLGWVMDDASGRRKEKDWISGTQLEKKTGAKHTQISLSLKRLIEEHHLIEATDVHGSILDTGLKRRNARSQIFYRLTLRTPEPTLFDKPRIRKTDTPASRIRNSDTQKTDTTKETHITKAILAEESAKPVEKKVEKSLKPISDHKLFIEFFYSAVKATRGVTTIITGADAKMLKRVLDSGVSRGTLEQCAVFFLSDPSFIEFSPTIRTLLSGGIITGILNKMKNGAEFWKRLDQYSMSRGLQKAIAEDPREIAVSTANLMTLRTQLLKGMKMPAMSTHDER